MWHFLSSHCGHSERCIILLWKAACGGSQQLGGWGRRIAYSFETRLGNSMGPCLKTHRKPKFLKKPSVWWSTLRLSAQSVWCWGLKPCTLLSMGWLSQREPRLGWPILKCMMSFQNNSQLTQGQWRWQVSSHRRKRLSRVGCGGCGNDYYVVKE